jgi:hypothetical protein
MDGATTGLCPAQRFRATARHLPKPLPPPDRPRPATPHNSCLRHLLHKHRLPQCRLTGECPVLARAHSHPHRPLHLHPAHRVPTRLSPHPPPAIPSRCRGTPSWRRHQPSRFCTRHPAPAQPPLPTPTKTPPSSAQYPPLHPTHAACAPSSAAPRPSRTLPPISTTTMTAARCCSASSRMPEGAGRTRLPPTAWTGRMRRARQRGMALRVKNTSARGKRRGRQARQVDTEGRQGAQGSAQRLCRPSGRGTRPGRPRRHLMTRSSGARGLAEDLEETRTNVVHVMIVHPPLFACMHIVPTCPRTVRARVAARGAHRNVADGRRPVETGRPSRPSSRVAAGRTTRTRPPVSKTCHYLFCTARYREPCSAASVRLHTHRNA